MKDAPGNNAASLSRPGSFPVQPRGPLSVVPAGRPCNIWMGWGRRPGTSLAGRTVWSPPRCWVGQGWPGVGGKPGMVRSTICWSLWSEGPEDAICLPCEAKSETSTLCHAPQGPYLKVPMAQVHVATTRQKNSFIGDPKEPRSFPGRVSLQGLLRAGKSIT